MSFGFVKKICPDKIINYENFELLNEKDPVQTSQQLKPCLEGKDIGLLTDAGCPNIADPGSKLILHAHQNDVNVIPLVGPSSILLAMMSSGLNGNNFSFNGYFPVDKNERIKRIKQLEILSKNHNQSQIFIETPYRNKALYEDLIKSLNDNTLLCIATNIGSKKERIKTLSVNDWKRKKLNLEKNPTIFIFHWGDLIF